MSVCDDGDSIIDYYRTKYENSDMRVQSQQSIAKKRNLPRIQPIGEVCLNIDPWWLYDIFLVYFYRPYNLPLHNNEKHITQKCPNIQEEIS